MATRKAKRSIPTVERKIHFYRMNVGTMPNGKPRIANLTNWLHKIDTLPFTSGGRYVDLEPGLATCCWVDHNQANHRLRFGSIRRSALPQVEQRGALSPLSIPASSGLAEQVHVVFFPNKIVGSEFNFYGPRLSRFSDYLAQRAGLVNPTVSFEPLIRQDVWEQLKKLKDVRVMQLQVRASYIERIAEIDKDLASAFEAAKKVSDAEVLEVILRMRPYSRDTLADRIAGIVRKIARRSDVREEASQFVVKGLNAQTGHIDQIDVLNDHLIAKKQIVRQDRRTRALDSSAAYAAIEEAYEELREELEKAASAVS